MERLLSTLVRGEARHGSANERFVGDQPVSRLRDYRSARLRDLKVVRLLRHTDQMAFKAGRIRRIGRQVSGPVDLLAIGQAHLRGLGHPTFSVLLQYGDVET